MIARVSVALVTGTSSGFGRGVAERLVRLGWTVVGTSRDPSRATAPAGCDMIPLDLRDPASIASAAGAVVRTHGRLDALVSNAGIAVLGPLEQLSMAEIRGQLEVNLIGTLDLCRTCLPALRESRGVIVQISSISGRFADEVFGAYSASKFGLGAVSDALADELADQGVRVVVVEPGPFRTPISSNVQLAAARDDSGLYARAWRELDEWIEWFPEGAEDPEVAIDAIVAAVTVPGAPLRLPVGRNTAQDLRDQANETLVAIDQAEEFLAANRGLGR
jgi:NAD(P)-dependent dehydrogenase (short-subunit alcohol dehydrogenase family)